MRDPKLIALLDAVRDWTSTSAEPGTPYAEHTLRYLREAAILWAADECPECGRRGDHEWDELTDAEELAHKDNTEACAG